MSEKSAARPGPVLSFTPTHIISLRPRRTRRDNYDCFFEKNVVATDGETKISAENLDLLAEENAVKIYNNVYLNNIEGSIRADYVGKNIPTHEGEHVAVRLKEVDNKDAVLLLKYDQAK